MVCLGMFIELFGILRHSGKKIRARRYPCPRVYLDGRQDRTSNSVDAGQTTQATAPKVKLNFFGSNSRRPGEG